MSQADEGTDKLSVAGVAEFTAAYQAWDGKRFAVAAEMFRQATMNKPASSTCFYWLGAAQFHRLLHVQMLPASPGSRLAADDAMDAALAALNTAIKLDERHAEGHALLAALYGMRIDGNLLRAARWGPRVQKHAKLAVEHGAQNPRVRYLLATCQFHTAKKPAAQREALASFLEAERLFRREAQRAAGPVDPRWGYSTCLTFIGRTYELLGQHAQAGDYFRKALLHHPTDHLAREGLARVTEKG